MALREINLVDPDLLYRRYLMRHLALWGGFLILVLVLIFGFYYYQTRVARSKAGPITNLEELQKHLGARISEIKQVQDELSKLDKQQAAIGVITKNQPYSEILLRLAKIIKPHAWLTQLAMKTDPKSDVLSVDLVLMGYSFTNDELGSFITKLNRDKMFKAVRLKFAREGEVKRKVEEKDESYKVVQFQIDCNVGREG